MKSFRSTWLMSLLVIAIAIYTFIDYRKAQREGAFVEGERAAFTFDPDEVDRILITRAQESIDIQSEGGIWKMSKPINDLVDDASVLAFLHAITSQRLRIFSPEDEQAAGPVDWATYGLDQPAVTFELRSGGKSESLSISSKNAFDGSFYLKQKGELLVGDTGLAQLKDRPASTFRSRLLFRDTVAAKKAQVEIGSEKFSILKKDGQWTIEPKPSYPLDAGKLEAWLGRVQEFKPAEIAKDGIGEEDKSAFQLAKPSMQIRLNDDWLLTLGQDRGADVFLYTNKMPTLYRNSVAGLAQIRVGTEYFRDGRKPFEFSVEQAKVIEVRTPKFSHVFKRVDGGWASADAAVEIDQDALVRLMQTLRGLEAYEFGAKGKAGIASAQLIVKDETGKELLTLAWGDEYKAAKSYNSGVPLRYVRTNLEKDVMGLPKEKLDTLISESLLKKKSAQRDSQRDSEKK